jgi:TldD protein
MLMPGKCGELFDSCTLNWLPNNGLRPTAISVVLSFVSNPSYAEASGLDADQARFGVDQTLRAVAEYAEGRIHRAFAHTYTLKNGSLQPVTISAEVGVGIRVIVDGAMGYASTNNLDREEIRFTTESAVRTAKVSKRLLASAIRLSQEKVWDDNWEAKMKVDVRIVSAEEKFELLHKIEKSLAKDNVHASVPPRIMALDESLTEKFYVNSGGSGLHGFVPRLKHNLSNAWSENTV